MSKTITCMHCGRPILRGVAEIGRAEVTALQHHLLSRCRPDEPADRITALADLMRHFRVADADS